MCTLIRADTVTGTNPASEFLMGSLLTGAESSQSKTACLSFRARLGLPGTGLEETKHLLLSITSAQSHLSTTSMGGFSQEPLLPGIIPETASSPKTLQHMTQTLLVPAQVPRGDAPGAIPPLHRLPGALWDPWASGVGWGPLQPLLLQPPSFSGGPPKALTSLSRFC